MKSLSEDFYLKYSGKSSVPVLENFKNTYKRGIQVDVSIFLIPGLVENVEIVKNILFISHIDPKIPYHITGYIPVPEAPWRSPTMNEINKAKNTAEEFLENVSISWFSSFANY